jgi:hypothetical protein
MMRNPNRKEKGDTLYVEDDPILVGQLLFQHNYLNTNFEPNYSTGSSALKKEIKALKESIKELSEEEQKKAIFESGLIEKYQKIVSNLQSFVNFHGTSDENTDALDKLASNAEKSMKRYKQK